MNEVLFRNVGVFDSGVGGLTVLRSLIKAFPDANYIYLGDTARVPYGIRSKETIRRFAHECCRFLEMQNADIIVVACNSASATALSYLQENLSVPVIGVIEPGVEFIEEKFHKDVLSVAIIGTRATVNSGTYQKYVKEKFNGVKIYSRACPLFVPLAEEGLLDHEITHQTVRYYLEGLKGEVDVVVLGCTHYPLLKRAIGRFMGDGVFLVESGPALVHSLKRDRIRFSGEGRRTFYVTDDSNRFTELSRLFLGIEIRDVELVDISYLEGLLKNS